MRGSFTVAELIKELRSAQEGITATRPQLTANLQSLEQVVFDVVEQAEPGDSGAQPIFQSMRRAQACLDTAFERRYAASRAIEDYLEAHFTGTNVQLSPMVQGSSGTGGTPTWADSAQERRERRKRANGWAWADLGFAAAGVALMFFPGAPLIVSAGYIAAKLGYTAWKIDRTHADRREAQKLLWAANGDAFIDMGWEVAKHMANDIGVEIVKLAPGMEIVGLAIDYWGAYKALRELSEIHSEWKRKGGG